MAKEKKSAKAAKAPARKKAAQCKADLDEMFRAAVSKNESFEIGESEDYGRAIEHFNEVIRLLDAILAIDPEYRDAINYKGMMFVGCGRNEDAIKCFDQILKLNPVDKEALNNKGIALYGLGRDEEALKCVEAAIAIDNRYADAYVNKAVILHALGRYEEADVFLRKARAFETLMS